MSSMTDPMNALVELQRALDRWIVSLQPCEIHKDISVIFDQPNGMPRYTYAKINNGKVQSIAVFALTQPVEGVPCFQLGWATVESIRGHGLATDTTTKGIDEFTNGLRKHGAGKFYLEAIVSDTNEPSNKIAKKLLSESPAKCTDSFSGEPAVQYLRIVK
ncbi:MAG: hypothetical protein WBJ41_14820 [Chromatiaceae bacterium]